MTDLPPNLPHAVEWRVRTMMQLMSCSDPETFEALFQAALSKVSEEARASAADLLDKMVDRIADDPRLKERAVGLKAGAKAIRHLKELDARDAGTALVTKPDGDNLRA